MKILIIAVTFLLTTHVYAEDPTKQLNQKLGILQEPKLQNNNQLRLELNKPKQTIKPACHFYGNSMVCDKPKCRMYGNKMVCD